MSGEVAGAVLIFCVAAMLGVVLGVLIRSRWF